MKLLSMMSALVLSLLFSFSAVAAQNAGSSATGPNVDCKMADGSIKTFPMVICKYYRGI